MNTSTIKSALALAKQRGVKVGQIYRYKAAEGENVSPYVDPLVVGVINTVTGMGQQIQEARTVKFNHGEFIIKNNQDLESFAIATAEHFDKVYLYDQEEESKNKLEREKSAFIDMIIKDHKFSPKRAEEMWQEKMGIQDAVEAKIIEK